MPGRKPGGLVNFERPWSLPLGKELTELIKRLRYAISGLQGTPDTPSTVQAGVDADAMGSQAPAPSNHVHAAETAAPSVPVAFGGAPSEGAGSALMRADAGLVLEGGVDNGDILTWDGNEDTWESLSPAEAVGAISAEEIVSDILTELKTITYILQRGLSVPDDPEKVRRSFEKEPDAMRRELRVIAYYLYVGLNVRPEPDQPRM